MSNCDPPYIATILRRLEELGMTEAELARRIGKAKGYFSNVLRGRMATPDVQVAIRIAQVLQMDIHSLFEGTKDIQLGVIITGAARGEGGMWKELDKERQVSVPLNIFGDDLVKILIDDDALEPVYGRGDVLMGTKTVGAHLHNLVGRDCIIKASNAEHVIGFIVKATSRGKFSVRAVGSRAKSPASDVGIDWAAPVQVVLKKAL
jgi:transcriptional regulator with XRE-family HTH domain